SFCLISLRVSGKNVLPAGGCLLSDPAGEGRGRGRRSGGSRGLREILFFRWPVPGCGWWLRSPGHLLSWSGDCPAVRILLPVIPAIVLPVALPAVRRSRQGRWSLRLPAQSGRSFFR